MNFRYVFPVSTWIPISEEAYDLGDGKKVKVKSVEKGQIAVVRSKYWIDQILNKNLSIFDYMHIC